MPTPSDRLARIAERVWYRPAHPFSLLLAPLGWLYCAIVSARASAYRRGWLRSGDCGAPVIVVGNLSVGGTGKTPLVIWLAEHLRRRGLRPGIATRGYGGRGGLAPRLVAAGDSAAQVGDEPLLLARRTGCPVAVGRDRLRAARLLVEEAGCDLVVTDDGLQHYRLRRRREIVVVDAGRGHGNRRCLPAGPLREPVRRAGRADLIVLNGAGEGAGLWMTLRPGDPVLLGEPERTRPLAELAGQPITAVAGIGNPERFFALLRAHGLSFRALAYPDHHPFSVADIARWPDDIVLMTEKDAVKVEPLLSGAPERAQRAFWSLPVTAVPSPAFIAELDRLFDGLGAYVAAAEPGQAARSRHRGSHCAPGRFAVRTPAIQSLPTRNPMDKRLLDILVCPICKSKLYYDKDASELICRHDRLAFPIRDDIPVMLEEEARPLDETEEVPAP